MNQPRASWRERRLTGGGSLPADGAGVEPPPYMNDEFLNKDHDNLGYFDDEDPLSENYVMKQSNVDEGITHM